MITLTYDHIGKYALYNLDYTPLEGYSKLKSHDYSKDYLTIVALDDGEFTITIPVSNYGINIDATYIAYSLDNGKTWVETPRDGSSEITITDNILNGLKMLLKSDGITWGGNNGPGLHSSISLTCEFNLEGNILSLTYGDNFKNEALSGVYTGLFQNTKIKSAKNLILPIALRGASYCRFFLNCTYLIDAPKIRATGITSDCYYEMFKGCTSLILAPDLFSKYTASNCYRSMFEGCTSLTTAPALLAETLEGYCCDSMFKNCTALASVPSFLALTLGDYSCLNMFYGCTSLTTTPTILATTLGISCCKNMFLNCTSLTVASDLPATTLANNCYYNMFNGCSSLITPPNLPAKTLNLACYGCMFQGCTSLTTAPVLPAEILVVNCYGDMFKGCINLNYIKALFTSTPTAGYTTSWVDGVAATGTFVKNSSASWDVTGIHGIPSGWIVETASE